MPPAYIYILYYVWQSLFTRMAVFCSICYTAELALSGYLWEMIGN
jgi:hypothetical protein